MNHYDVMGVRPNASQEEIELAYRSRRSQYHPDKYAGTDAETLGWATGKMQEVNLAYTALSDPGKRKVFDASSAMDRRPVQEPRPAAGRREARGGLQDFLRARLSPYAGFSRIYFSPRIPAKKLAAARGNYAADIKEEQVVALIDSTVFGGAKEGIVLTEEGMRIKDLLSSATDLRWSDARSLEVRGTAIWFNGHQVTDSTMVDKPELQRLFGAVREFLQDVGGTGPASSVNTASNFSRTASSEAPWTDPVMCQEVYAAAKQHVVELSDLLEPVEQEVEEQWLDRPALASLLEMSLDALDDPKKARLAYRWVSTVGQVCEAAVTSLNQGGQSIDPKLLQGSWDEPVALRDLRLMLKNLFAAIREEREKERAKRFFRK